MEDYGESLRLREFVLSSKNVVVDDDDKNKDDDDEGKSDSAVAGGGGEGGIVGRGGYDRRIADLHHSIAVTCLGMAAEGEKRMTASTKSTSSSSSSSNSLGAMQGAMAKAMASAAAPPAAPVLTPEEIASYRRRSLNSYVRCGRCLGGIVMTMCGIDDPTSEMINDGGECDTAATPSESLREVRERVSNLTPAKADDAERVLDLLEMMDEIQESIDTAEDDEGGMRMICEMRRRAEAEAEGEGEGGEEREGGGGTTTVGFGNATTSAVGGFVPTPSSSSFALASDGAATGVKTATAAGAAAMSPPMMVIKKKTSLGAMQGAMAKARASAAAPPRRPGPNPRGDRFVQTT